MDKKNKTTITMIHLLGFWSQGNVRWLPFFMFLTIYSVTMCGNLLIIILVFYGKSLHTPMYFFLSQLSLSDIILATDIVPNMLHTILAKGMFSSLSDCLTQFFFFSIPETLECLLLMVMSYDRYLAICKPLHYALTMNTSLCWKLVILCWILSISNVLLHTITISQLQFCGENIIDHFFCDLEPILELACSDTSILQLEITSLGPLLVVTPFFIIIVSYVCIINTILKIPSITGRKKAFSTCSSHVTVVSIYYVTLVCVYIVPSKGQLSNTNKFPSLLYTVLIPMLNPIIYSLRNKDLKEVLGKLINKFFIVLG